MRLCTNGNDFNRVDLIQVVHVLRICVTLFSSFPILGAIHELPKGVFISGCILESLFLFIPLVLWCGQDTLLLVSGALSRHTK